MSKRYTLTRIGDPTADVVCPHGHAVDHINRRDYSVTADQDPAQVTAADLVEWLADNAEVLADFCMGHA